MELVARAKSIVHASPNRVYDCFVNPELMKQFWFHRKDQGLQNGESVKFYIGDKEDAYGITVQVIDLKPGSLIHIKWGNEDGWTEVNWSLEETDDGDTILTIEEFGYSGSQEDILTRIVDSTGGFNQVIIAAKALLEHGAAINVVSDHV